jgi:hypothetical protein
LPRNDADARAYDFVMNFISVSKRYKDPHIEKFQEVLANFIVDPQDFSASSVEQPYIKGQRRHIHRSRGIILKDAETHKAIMTYAAKLVQTVLGDGRGEYVRADPVGWEDATTKSPTVTRLLRYAFALPGHFRTMVEAVVDMLLFGTAVVEVNWKYQEREQLVRSVEDFGGVTIDDFTRQRVVAWDDPTISVIDIQDFYPDPSHYRIEDMLGVAKKITLTAMQAREKVAQGIYREQAVERAIKMLGVRSDENRERHEEAFREGIDQPEYRDTPDDFVPMLAFEYWGEVPWEDDRGSSRRVITIINSVVVRDDPYPLADADLPFRSMTINPVVGRFYGVSPAEVIRWDQSLQDAVKILLAEAIIRQVHPPVVYDMDADIDLNKLRRWSPDIPIGSRGGANSVGTLKYEAGVFSGFQQAASLKQSMQEASGALGIIQGQGLGTKRSSATEAAFTGQQALSRPELAAMLLERDAMPLIGKSLVRRYQQFLEDDEDLRLRVGAMPQPIWIGDIMGDFDIAFVGSRQAISRQEKLQAYDRLAAMTAALPQAGLQVPWQLLLSTIVGDVLELPDVAALIGDPTVIKTNIVLNHLAQQGQGAGNGNATVPTSEPSGLAPAQAAGNILGAGTA